MPRWIETSNGFVNLDHVVRLDRSRRDGGQRDPIPWTITLVDGTQAVGLLPEGVWLPDLLADVVPATAGQEALAISVDGPDDTRPTEVFVARYPVTAWRVASADHTAARAVPVLPASGASNQRLFLCLPDGRLSDVDGFGDEFDDEEAAKAWVLRLAQQDWDREHVPQEAAAGLMGAAG